MTVRPRQLRAVIAARGRLRDLAGAVHAQATAAEQQAAAQASSAAAELDHAIADAGKRMATSAGIAELMRIADELAGDRALAAAAERERQAASARAQQSAAQLRQRERELRTVERVLEDCREELALAAERGEQRVTDDHGGRRRQP
ncbi:MAG TPA: hypothetical protein VHE35_19805 [Kofleriaceae bacterium]|nr:hypothetical protein [Kofleriaceae bacterium]